MYKSDNYKYGANKSEAKVLDGFIGVCHAVCKENTIERWTKVASSPSLRKVTSGSSRTTEA